MPTMPATPPIPEFLTPAEVAVIVKLKLCTVVKLVDRGEFPGSINVGAGKSRVRRIPPSAVREFIRAREIVVA